MPALFQTSGAVRLFLQPLVFGLLPKVSYCHPAQGLAEFLAPATAPPKFRFEWKHLFQRGDFPMIENENATVRIEPGAVRRVSNAAFQESCHDE